MFSKKFYREKKQKLKKHFNIEGQLLSDNDPNKERELSGIDLL